MCQSQFKKIYLAKLPASCENNDMFSLNYNTLKYMNYLTTH
jgi:hypothetical protein